MSEAETEERDDNAAARESQETQEVSKCLAGSSKCHQHWIYLIFIDCILNYLCEMLTQIKRSAHPSVGRITRSVAANSPTLAPQLFISEDKMSTPKKRTGICSVIQ